MSGRTPAGLAMLVLGGIWIAQGIDVLKGSPMTGVSFWAWAGVVLVIGGIGMIGWDVARLVRRRTGS